MENACMWGPRCKGTKGRSGDGLFRELRHPNFHHNDLYTQLIYICSRLGTTPLNIKNLLLRPTNPSGLLISQTAWNNLISAALNFLCAWNTTFNFTWSLLVVDGSTWTAMSMDNKKECTPKPQARWITKVRRTHRIWVLKN